MLRIYEERLKKKLNYKSKRIRVVGRPARICKDL